MAETRDHVRRSAVLARLRSDPRAWCAAVAVAAAVFVAWRTLLDTAYLYHPLPYWDYWDFVAQLPRYLSGDFGLADLWSQHNEHRILCGRLVFLADALWFGGNGALDVVVSCLVQCGHTALLCYVTAGSLLRGPVRVLVAAVTAACLMFGSQSVNLFWPFQVPFVLVYFAITASLLQVARPDPGAGRLLVAALLACVACASMANGLLVWPLLWSLCVQLRLPRRALLFLVLAGAAMTFAFLYGYRMASGSTVMDSVRDPVRFAVHVCVLLGNPLWSLGIATAASAGGITLLLAAWTLLRRVRSWFQATPMEALLLHLVLLALGSVALAAVARLDMSRALMLHGRYGLPVLVLWAALFGLWFRGPRPRAGGWWRIGAATAFVLGLAFLAPRQRDPQAPMRDAGAYAAACLLSGVRDLECMRHIHGVDPQVTLERAEILRSRRLSVFGTGLQDLVGQPLRDHFAVDGEASAKARVGPPQAVTGDPSAVRLEGFAWQRNTGLPPELIVVADEQGRIAGLGMCRLGHDADDGRNNWCAWARAADHPGRRLLVYGIWNGSAVPLQ